MGPRFRNRKLRSPCIFGIIPWSIGAVASMTRAMDIHGPGLFYSQNNLCINSSNSGGSGSPTASLVTISNNMALTDALANTDGYTNTEAFVYSPISNSSPSVGKGVNLTPLWPAGFSAQDSSIVCTQQTVNTLSFSRFAPGPHARPANGAWDVGSYQFTAGSTSQPNPPTGLKSRPLSEPGKPQEKCGFLARSRNDPAKGWLGFAFSRKLKWRIFQGNSEIHNRPDVPFLVRDSQSRPFSGLRTATARTHLRKASNFVPERGACIPAPLVPTQTTIDQGPREQSLAVTIGKEHCIQG